MRVCPFPGILAVGCCPPRTTGSHPSHPQTQIILRTVELDIGGEERREKLHNVIWGREGGDGKGRKGKGKERSRDTSLHYLDSWIQPCLKHTW